MMKIKILSLVTISLLLNFALYPLVEAASFSDVPERHMNYTAIEYLKAKNALQGYPDGIFRPDQEVNRVEALKLILEGLDYYHFDKDKDNILKDKQLTYLDVGNDAWYSPYLKRADEDLITGGYPDKTFKPAQYINLAEALKMIILTNKIDLSVVKIEAKPFADVEGDSWFAKFVQYAKNKNIIAPQSDGLLHPEREITRGELTEIIFRLRKIIDNKWEKYELSENWPEYTNLEHYYKVKFPGDKNGWVIIKNGKNTIFWKKQTDLGQIDYLREFPNSASVSVMLFENEGAINAIDYFNEVKKAFQSINYSMVEKKVNGDLPALSLTGFLTHENIIDWHIYLPNKKILILHGSFGKGPMADYLQEQILALLNSFTYLPDGGIDTSGMMETARKNVMVDGKGQETLNLFPDKALIATDPMGVGTGPVDYYFSELTNVTLKFERSLNVILAIKEGNTDGF